ncbi:O-antigen ligase family protein [Gammaproteobacteria bacterium]|nr:O-antigen ligase family protein [Gammaproteobacteria bacterium]
MSREESQNSIFSKHFFEPVTLCVFLLILGIFLSPSQSFASYPSYLLVLIAAISPGVFFRVFGVPSFIFFGLVLVYFLLSTAWSEGTEWRSFGSSLVRVVLVLAFVLGLATMYTKKPDTSFLPSSVILVGFFAAVISIVLHVDLSANDWNLGTRMNGLSFLENPVLSGILFALAMLCSLDRWLKEKTLRNRVLLSLILVILALAVFLCGSVNSQISLFVAVSVLLIKRKALSAPSVLFSVLVVFLVFAIWSQIKSLDELVAFFLPRGDSYRLAIWQATMSNLDLWQTFFGNGMGSNDDITIESRTFLHPHSLYLSIFFEAGLLGLLLSLSMIFLSGRVLWKSEAKEAALFFSILVLGVVSFIFDSHELIDKVDHKWLLLWCPIGFSVALVLNELSKGSQKQEFETEKIKDR